MSHCWMRWRNSMVMMLAAFQMPKAAWGLMAGVTGKLIKTLLSAPANSGGKLNTGENRNVVDRSALFRLNGGDRVAPARYWASARYSQVRVTAEPSRNFQPRLMSKPGMYVDWPVS